MKIPEPSIQMIVFSSPPERWIFSNQLKTVSIALMKYNNYSDWAFNGMQGIDKESEGLIAFFTDISYSSSENLFSVTFDINLIWPFGRKGNVMKFRPSQTYSDSGELEAITLIPELKGKMVEAARLDLYVNNHGSTASVAYASRLKLSGFLDFFFSLRSYKKNFEWYIYKVAENLTEHLDGR